VSLTVIYDTTKIIRQSLQGVTSSAILGAALAMIVLFFFLRSFKSTIIIGLSIPISLLVTIMVMYFSGLTLNIMTLAGLTLGIGMIVDSSIVILENIFRYREKGAKAGPAAHLGAQEMITAITASILTTVGIFLPLLLFKKELDLSASCSRIWPSPSSSHCWPPWLSPSPLCRCCRANISPSTPGNSDPSKAG
jgi:HAE1 family hydrophobic/amphiphilic exporter-1